jgi:hypothetical protein
MRLSPFSCYCSPKTKIKFPDAIATCPLGPQTFSAVEYRNCRTISPRQHRTGHGIKGFAQTINAESPQIGIKGSPRC